MRGSRLVDPLRRRREAQARARAQQPLNSRALVGYTPDGTMVGNPLQAELRRMFKGVRTRQEAARLEGDAPTPKRLRKDPSTRKARFNGEYIPAASKFAGQGHGDVEYVPVERTNRLVTVGQRDTRRLRLAERDKHAEAYRVELAKRVAERVAQEATEAPEPHAGHVRIKGARIHGSNRPRSHRNRG